MRFSHVPKISKNQINKAGQTLKKGPKTHGFNPALKKAEKWRACHAYPINTFQATLRTKVNKYSGNPIVAQRLKRMTTVIDKLKRYEDMNLTTMQDIAGVRAIVSTVKDVYQLANDYKENKRLQHVLYDQKDYIKNTRDSDGYRSIHLIYKYKNKMVPEYNGLRVEMQIRTHLQHTWATAVETMGTFLGQALKTRRGSKKWLDFFANVSSAFAYMENTNVLPRHQGKAENIIFKSVVEMEKELNALEIMRGVSMAIKVITDKHKEGWFYHVIILDALNKTVQLMPFNRDSHDKAIKKYNEVEDKALKGEKIEPVLVSAGPLAKLRVAYPNFFLDISKFITEVEKIINRSE